MPNGLTRSCEVEDSWLGIKTYWDVGKSSVTSGLKGSAIASSEWDVGGEGIYAIDGVWGGSPPLVRLERGDAMTGESGLGSMIVPGEAELAKVETPSMGRGLRLLGFVRRNVPVFSCVSLEVGRVGDACGLVFPRINSLPSRCVGVVGGAVLGEDDWYESRDGRVASGICR